jgi:hypothetical protein
MATDPDAVVLKSVNEAEAALARLMGELRTVTAKIDKGEANPAKVKAAQAKVLAYMKKYSSITKLQNSAVFDRLSPATQADVVWFDGVMGDLLGLLDKASWVESAARLDPKKKPKEVLAAIEKAQKQWSFKGLGTVVKQMEKGIDHWDDGGAGLAFLPMAIMLFIFWTMTKELLSRRTKK